MASDHASFSERMLLLPGQCIALRRHFRPPLLGAGAAAYDII